MLSTLVRVDPSAHRDRKYRALFSDGKMTHFGSKGVADYTVHKNRGRKILYMKRHVGDVMVGSDPTQPEMLTWYISWGFTSMEKNIRYYNKYIIPAFYGTGTPLLDYELFDKVHQNHEEYTREMEQLGFSLV